MNNNKQLDDDEILDYVHTKRTEIITSLTKSGVPSDVDTLRVLITALKDMDSQAINKKRIRVEEKTSDLQAQSAALIARVLMSTDTKININNIHNVMPSLPKDIPAPMLVDGEIDIFPTEITYDTFISNFTEN